MALRNIAPTARAETDEGHDRVFREGPLLGGAAKLLIDELAHKPGHAEPFSSGGLQQGEVLVRAETDLGSMHGSN
jgi:hypothetical protein